MFKIPVLGVTHWAAHRLLRAAGYRWELRRNGELKIGLWRKSIGRRGSKGRSVPKRLVIVPGFGDTPISWLTVATLLWPVLRKQYQEVVLFDFPGFGGFLARERSFHSMDLLLKTVHDVLASLKPHTVLGHSLGGWLTAHYAVNCSVNYSAGKGEPHPALVILASPAGAFASLEVRDQWEKLFRTAIREGFSAIRPHLFAKEPYWFRLIASEFAGFASREEVIQFMESVREEHLVEAGISKLRGKVWLLWGEADSMIPADCLSAWLDRLTTDHKAVVLRGVGHSPHVENPAALAAVLGQLFLDRTPHRVGERWWKTIKT